MPKLPIMSSFRASPPLVVSTEQSSVNSRPLANIEADHRSACRWLDEWSAPEGVKEPLACRLEARHRTEWELHVLRLAKLHQKRMLLAMAVTGEHTDGVSSGFGAGQGQSKLPRPFPPVCPGWMMVSPS